MMVIGSAIALPVYWMLVTSLKPLSEIYGSPAPFWPLNPTMQHYERLLGSNGFLAWILTALVVGFASTTISVTFAVPYAYFVARFTRPSNVSPLKGILLLCYLFPPVFTALFLRLSFGSFFDHSPFRLALAYPILQIPVSVWLIDAAIRRLPREVEESVLVDGGSIKDVLLHAIIPGSIKGIVAAIIFCLWVAWGDYALAFVLTPSQQFHTFTTGLTSLQTGDVLEWGRIMAAGILTIVMMAPLAIFGTMFLLRGNREP
jgi:multiple sugar transport system permease protein